MLFDPRWHKPLDAISPPLNAVQRVLMQAKAAIEQHGWVQGDFGDTKIGFCVMGALDHIIGDRDCRCGSHDGAYRDVYHAICVAIHTKSVGGWNDIPGRTKQEVLAKFDEAIKWAGAKKESADVA